MKHLFSAEGEAALLAVMKRRPLLAFDFDGTLAPIVARPEDARIPTGVAHRLRRLADRFPVAIISGRKVNDVLGRLGFRAAHIFGNHGAEDPAAPLPTHLFDELDRLRSRLRNDRDLLVGEGIYVEDKGMSLALHYRLARDRDRAALIICTLLEEFSSVLKVFGGKMVVNVMPLGVDDKGQAVLKLLGRTGTEAAVYVGDDINDEPAFACATPEWVTVRIGREHALSKAQYFLDSTSDVPLMLERLLAACDPV
jgi:trehalose 6-phosphate phosphatase